MNHCIAAIQMTSSEDVEKNLIAASALIKEAAQGGAQLAVLPEMFAVLGHPSAKMNVTEQLGQGPIQDFLAYEAKKNNIWLVGGTIPLACEDSNKFKSTCLVHDNSGQLQGHYNKIHLFDANISNKEFYKESAITSPGETTQDNITVIDTPVGKIGLSVCYDIRFPELMRKLIDNGAEIIIAPSAFTVPTGEAHWKILAQAVAVQNLCYFVGAAQGGDHSQGRRTYGHSLIVDPWGKILAEVDTSIQKEQIILAEININKVATSREKIPVLQHRRFTIL